MKQYLKIRTVSVFSWVVLFALFFSACSSARYGASGNKRKSTYSRSQGYYSKNKSGNKRANHRPAAASRSTAGSSRSKSTGGEEYFEFDEAGSRSGTSSRSSASGGSRASASMRVQTVIDAARSYTGTPYRYGGTTKRGMDCSGLLCTSFNAANMQLPRTSNEQSAIGKTVSVRNLEPGDLVFFSGRKGSRKITHVGMVTEVNGRDNVRFIHASTSRGVREDDLYSAYYQGIFVKAVRPF